MNAENFIHKIIFKKFEIKKVISKSIFSSVYEGRNIINNKPVALKIVKNDSLKLLEFEAYLLINLKGFGIPEVMSYGRNGSYNILIEELLGQNIDSLWEKFGYKEDPLIKKNKTLKDICMIAIQGLDRLKYIHNKNIIHCNIKPKKFIIGRNVPQNIYLVDYRFSKKYKNSHTGKHIKFSNKYSLIGSLCFSSCNAIRGLELSRRDDLESLGYVLLYLAKGRWLPWLKSSKINMEEAISKLKQIKSEIKEENLCKGLPIEFISYMKYVKHLRFEEDPDYKYLKGLFLSVLTRIQMANDLNFFWITKQNSKSQNKIKSLKFDNEKLLKIFNNGSAQKTEFYHKMQNKKDKINFTKFQLNNFLKRNISNNMSRNKGKTSIQFNNNTNSTCTFFKLKNFKDLLDSKPNSIYKNKNNISSYTNKNFEINSKSIEQYSSKISNFKREYSRLRKTKVDYMPKEFNKKGKMNESINQRPRNKLYNKIFYNKLYFINKNISKKNSINKSRNIMQQNSEKNITFEPKKIYKSVLDQ